jgi:hypothetical protein
MKTIVAFDPEVDSPAFAKVVGETVIDYGVVLRRSSGKTFNLQFTDDVESIIKDADVVVVEDQYLSTSDRAKRNVRSFSQLVSVRAEISLVAREAKKKVVILNPSVWQSAMLRCNSRMKREQRKRMSIMVARAFMNGKDIDHNIADAVNMALYQSHRKEKENVRGITNTSR